VGLPNAANEGEDIMQIGSCNVRRSVITVIVVVVAGLTATASLANSPHFKKGREPELPDGRLGDQQAGHL
jgi:hypothetical protein